MLETAIDFVSQVPWYWVLLFALFITFLENVFPPSPSDTVLVFTGTLISGGTIGFFPLLFTATAGSVLGFLAMYILGKNFDRRIIESGRFSFISREGLQKVESWFHKWGYALIVANRFLSGTRAVISFFAGMTGLKITLTIVLSALSALIWNAILIYLGYAFGENWEEVKHYMDLYGKIIAPVAVVLIAGFFGIKWYIANRKKQRTDQ
ncbi:MAG: DedA family protein [Candidatus Kapaibacterium sp.]